MVITEKKRVALAVGVALSGIPPASPICRLARAQVIFPDIGELLDLGDVIAGP